VLRTSQGESLGMLCVTDIRPRPDGLTAEQTDSLLALARQTVAMLQFRRALRWRDDAARAHSDRAEAADSAQQAGGIGTFEIDIDSNTLRPSPEFCRLFGLPPTPAMDAGVIDRIVIPEDRDKVSGPGGRTGIATLDSEYRIRRADDGELRWLSRRGEFGRDAAGRATLLRGVVQDITERKRVEVMQETLNREISHRNKNTLAMVDAIALQTLRHTADRAAVQDFSRRIQALARAHDILISRSLAGADLRTTVTTVAAVIADPARVVANGPEITLNARTTLSFSLMIHELATNAAKYGALSGAGGVVRVDWSIEAAPKGRQLVLTWQEEGGPSVSAPTRKGFGSRLIESGFSGTGGVEVRYRPEGLHATFRVPLSFITG
jgi:PAS domain S-box-containing protein